jgi:hypothetical protein
MLSREVDYHIVPKILHFQYILAEGVSAKMRLNSYIGQRLRKIARCLPTNEYTNGLANSGAGSAAGFSKRRTTGLLSAPGSGQNPGSLA